MNKPICQQINCAVNMLDCVCKGLNLHPLPVLTRRLHTSFNKRHTLHTVGDAGELNFFVQLLAGAFGFNCARHFGVDVGEAF